MLKVYLVKSYYKVDDEPWGQFGSVGHLICEEPKIEGKLYCEKASWDEVYSNVKRSSIWTGQTFWRRRPYIEIGLGWSSEPRRFYKGSFRELTLIDAYDEWTNCSLEWIMKHASADQAIQYMKERGMTACPMQ